MEMRLDYISEFENPDFAIGVMTEIRKTFINLDGDLRQLLENTEDVSITRNLHCAQRNLEIALQSAIKALCLKYEKKS